MILNEQMTGYIERKNVRIKFAVQFFTKNYLIIKHKKSL